MVYDFIYKKIDDVELQAREREIFELLVKFDGAPLTLSEIRRLILARNPNRDITENTIRCYINNINKRTNHLISNRYGYGYYINEEVRLMWR